MNLVHSILIKHSNSSVLFITFSSAMFVQHQTTEVICQQEMYEKCKQTLSELKDKLNVSISALSDEMTKIEEHQIKSDKTTMSAFEQIYIICNSLLNCVEACRKRLKKLVEEADDKIKATLVEQKSSLGNRRGRLTAHLNLIQRVQHIAPCNSLVTMVPQLKDRITNLGLATALPEARQDFKMMTLTIDRRALFLVQRELEKIGDIVVSSSFALVISTETAGKQENQESDLVGCVRYTSSNREDNPLPDNDRSAKEFLTEMDLLQYNALESWLGKDFTFLIRLLWVVVEAQDSAALGYIEEKLNSLRQESVSLTPDLTVPSEDWLNATAERVSAFIKLHPDYKEMYILTLRMVEAKYPVTVKIEQEKLKKR